jgi:hypothetical protein
MKTKKQQLKDFELIMIGLAFVVLFILVVIVVQNAVQKQHEAVCQYANSNATISKMQFDFANAYYHYPYNQAKVDFAYAIKYCKGGK